MANIATVLKEEIARIARKELRRETDNLKKASARFRSEIAALKRRIVELERKVARTASLGSDTPAVVPPRTQETEKNVRFSASGLKKHRQRLGLSAPMLAGILGVSPQTIYNWEGGATRPTAQQISNIAILRGMGKREVLSRLKQQGSGS